MGVDWRDLDNDGRPDLFVTALSNETFPYYRNQGKGVFADVTYQSKIGAATLPLSGWGAGIYDFDNDGRKDIFAACGDVQDNTEVYSSRKSRQPNLLLLNRSDGSFVPRTFEPASMYRGAAFADFDGDGRIDVIVTRLNERAMLLRNAMRTTNHWIGLQLEGTKSNRHGIGARVRVGKQWNHVTTSVGYASSSQREVHFGLGKEGTVEQIEIRWPSGVTQIVENPAVDQLLKVRESPTGSR
jgi:hypothetical protein